MSFYPSSIASTVLQILKIFTSNNLSTKHLILMTFGKDSVSTRLALVYLWFSAIKPNFGLLKIIFLFLDFWKVISSFNQRINKNALNFRYSIFNLLSQNSFITKNYIKFKDHIWLIEIIKIYKSRKNEFN